MDTMSHVGSGDTILCNHDCFVLCRTRSIVLRTLFTSVFPKRINWYCLSYCVHLSRRINRKRGFGRVSVLFYGPPIYSMIIDTAHTTPSSVMVRTIEVFVIFIFLSMNVLHSSLIDPAHILLGKGVASPFSLPGAGVTPGPVLHYIQYHVILPTSQLPPSARVDNFSHVGSRPSRGVS